VHFTVMRSQNDDILTTLKLLIIGESGVGKSSLLLRFTDNVFDAEHPATIGVDFKVKTLTINGDRVKLAIWDTAGQERFRTLTPSYYRGAQGVVFVYDVANRESFDRIKTWQSELETYTTQPNIVKMLVGNKNDKNAEVRSQDARSFADRNHMIFVEASAKTDDHVKYVFETLVHQIINIPSLWETDARSIQPGHSKEREQQSGWCASCGV